MDSLPFADTLVKEYLLFRGFTRTLEAFSSELEADHGTLTFGYQAHRMSALLFGTLIPELHMTRTMEFLELLSARLYVHLDSRFDATIRTLEQSIIKCMLVTAVKQGHPDKVDAFFRQWGDELLQSADGHMWREWCALSFVHEPWHDPLFQWAQLLETSFCNFLNEVVSRLPLPTLLRFNTDRRSRQALRKQVDELSAAAQVSADRATTGPPGPPGGQPACVVGGTSGVGSGSDGAHSATSTRGGLAVGAAESARGAAESARGHTAAGASSPSVGAAAPSAASLGSVRASAPAASASGAEQGGGGTDRRPHPPAAAPSSPPPSASNPQPGNQLGDSLGGEPGARREAAAGVPPSPHTSGGLIVGGTRAAHHSHSQPSQHVSAGGAPGRGAEEEVARDGWVDGQGGTGGGMPCTATNAAADADASSSCQGTGAGAQPPWGQVKLRRTPTSTGNSQRSDAQGQAHTSMPSSSKDT